MVAARQGNMKRKNMNKGGNMRKNFKQGQPQQSNNGGFKPNFPRNNRNNGMNNMTNTQLFNQMMNSVSQMMDNPGYMDFNEPNIRSSYPLKNGSNNNGMSNQNGGGMNINNNKNKLNRGGRGGRMGFNKPGNTNGFNPRVSNNNSNVNGNNQRTGNGNNGGRFAGSGRNNQQQNNNFGMNGNMKNGNNGQYRNGGGQRMIPMNGMGNGMGNGMRANNFDNYGAPQFYPQRFNPGPMMPPPPPQIMRLPMRGPMMSRRPLPPGPMPQFRSNNGPRNGPIRRKMGGTGAAGGTSGQIQNNQRRGNHKGSKNRRRIGKRNPNGDKYPLSKPWVTDEIKTAHEKKIELSNQLKGKKDDQLFAEFKKQRDAFVGLYETARTEYNKQKQQVIKFIDHFQFNFYLLNGIT